MDRRQAIRQLGFTGGFLTLSPITFLDKDFESNCNFNETEVQKQIGQLQNEPPADAQIRVERGGPRLFLNQEETYPLFAWSWELKKYTPHFKKSGINIIYPILQIGDGWLASDHFDWSKFDRFFAKLLALNPDAYFLPRLLLYLPQWWKENHPDELIKTCFPFTKAGNMSTPELLIGEGGQRWWRDYPRAGSFASDVWRNDVSAMLKRFLQHFENSPLRSRLIGYHIGAGTTGGEWHYSHAQFLPDVSKPMKQKLGYVPDAETRLKTSFGLFRDPEKEQKVIQFYHDYHNLIANTILSFSKIVKDETKRRILCGVFYTYLLENTWIQEGGHLAPQKILKSNNIDFIASPYTYQKSNVKGSAKGATDVYDQVGNWLGRGRGIAGDGGYRILIDSIQRHGKLPCVEMDPATYVDKGKDPDYAGSGSGSLKGSVKLLRRDLGQMFVTGCGGWLCDIGAVKGKGWYSTEPIIKAIQEPVSLGKNRKNLNIGSVSKIAAIYDAKSFFATKHWRAEDSYQKGGTYLDYFNYWFLDSQVRAIHRLGAPVDFLYRFDLTTEDTQKYRLFFMVNLFYLDDNEVRFLRGILKNCGSTIVWYYAPGFVSPTSLDLKQMEKLTGFQFNVIKEPGPMMIKSAINDESARINITFGTKEHRYPRFGVTDHSAQVLGHWADSEEVAFARKEMDGWSSVYVGAAPVPVEILRWFFNRSHARLWCDSPDIVRAVEDSAMIVATKAGRKKLTLHKPMAEVGTNRVSRDHNLNMEFGEVKIFTVT